ncbi:bifunctional glyoxylate/hydroxypyruvate reductase B [Lentibacillus kapialis]|uniref:Bifunctional glyoxylate/hydroxypyruvate reductase B n=1 Tax=Lentibacillus kapialis TaxID=340214 RepID=A0A917PQT0_9BACI|nr:D-glycerate dehydrogenase [Lentibacillus kapialis]GGJ87544.1 bifunctional glyoxylate/hydroxypyruvate reductase B [Lentibacillus kapialis]
MKKKIIAYNRVEQPVLDDLKEKYDVRFFKNIDTNNNPEFLNHLSEAEGIIGLETPVDVDMLNHAPHLKIVSNVSVGYDNLALEEMTERNIMATNTPGILTDTVADAVFGILVATARRIPELDHFVKKGQWQAEAIGEEHYGTNIHHKTLGIIGMGQIGNAIAKRGHFGFDMEILYHSRRRKPEAEKTLNAGYRQLEELLEESDFVVMITPMTPETEGMIGKREFQMMKKSAIFINGSRGKTIVEQDLIEALENGWITAAGLDVYEQEPINLDNPLLNMKRVVTTPHIGSSTYETELSMSQLAGENLQIGLTGKRPPNLVNPGAFDDNN